jgi:hypothetical protein
MALYVKHVKKTQDLRKQYNYWYKFNASMSCINLSLFPVAPTLEHSASVKLFVSLQFLNPKTVGRTPWTGDQAVARPLLTQTQNERRHTSMPWMGYEPTIPVFERAKSVHALNRAATVIDLCNVYFLIKIYVCLLKTRCGKMGEKIKRYHIAKKNKWRQNHATWRHSYCRNSLPSGEIPLSPWNCNILSFRYHNMYNWNGACRQLSLDT